MPRQIPVRVPNIKLTGLVPARWEVDETGNVLKYYYLPETFIFWEGPEEEKIAYRGEWEWVEEVVE